MIKFDKQELLKIARLSALKLDEKETVLFAQQIQAVLDYVEQLQQVDMTQEAQSVRNTNVFRPDVAQPCAERDAILEQAPEKKDTYFVVPKILD